MTANRRIFWNFVATYGRSVYTLIIGLICGRWTLMALGDVDYGLMGLVGGLTMFISFFNSLMSSAIGRFFAFSVGEAQRSGGKGVEICREWFNTALLIHTAIPAIMLLVGYPVGVWAVESFLTIPPDRVLDCIWVWRCVCLTCFVGMVSAPFTAMYGAKQYIAELTVYTFVTVTLNAIFLRYMVTHPGKWLVKLMFWNSLLGIAPQILIAVRAVKLFPECRLVPRYLWSVERFKQVFLYAFYRFFGALATMIKRQGMDILVNKYLGPAKNAAMNVAGTVSGHCNNLAGSFLTALTPAIANAYGVGDMRRVHTLSYSACKYSAIMVLVFVLPMLIEADEVFHLWLVNPPAGTVFICRCLMLIMFLENVSCGLFIPIFCDGRIAAYQTSTLFAGILTIPIAWLLIARAGFGVEAIGYALIVGMLVMVLLRCVFSRAICKMSINKWLFCIFLPITIVSVVAVLVGVVCTKTLTQSFVRVVITTVAVNLTFLPLAYGFVMDKTERKFFVDRIGSKFAWKRK